MSGRLITFAKRASVSQKSGTPFVARGAQAKAAVQQNKPASLANASLRSNTLSNPTISKLNESIKESYQKSRTMISERVASMQNFGYEKFVFKTRFDCPLPTLFLLALV